MKKTTLIATAVAMVISGSAMAAGHGGTKFYGQMQLNLESNDDVHMSSGKLVLGWKGSEKLDNGLTVGFGLELEHDNADEEKSGATTTTTTTATGTTTPAAATYTSTSTTSTAGQWTNDKSFLFVKGSFGTIFGGRHGSFRNWACHTDVAKYDADRACDASSNPTAANNLLGYTGKSGDISYGLATTFDGNGTGNATSATTFGLKYKSGPISAGFSSFTPDGGDAATVIGGSYAMGNFTILASIGNNGGSGVAEVSATDLGVKVGLGKGSHVAVVTTSSDDILDSTVVSYHNSLSKRSFVKVEMLDVENAADTKVRATLGHKF